MVKSHREKHSTSHSTTHAHETKTHDAHHSKPEAHAHAHNASHDASHKAKSKKSTTSKLFVWQGTVLILAVLLILAIFTQGFTTLFNGNSSSDKPANLVDQVANPLSVELYVMSQCPYGVQAEGPIFSAIKSIGEENFDFTLEYIASDTGNGNFNSLHGQNEVDGDIAQLCARSLDETKFLDYVSCMNKDSSSIPSNRDSCATQVGLDVDALKTCYEGQAGKDLLSASALASQAKGASASPTIYIDNSPYQGGRSEMDFKRAFCNAFGDEQPAACADIPAPVAVELTVLSDDACGAACDTTQIVQASQGLFPGVTIKKVDIDSKEGKALIQENNFTVIPMYIFDKNVAKTESWKQPQFDTNFLKLADGSYMLRNEVTGASYYISEEVRNAQIAKMGVVTGDNKPDLDFFVMSFCPYGNIAEEIIQEVYNTLGDSVDFKPHYIYYANYQGGGDTYCMDDASLYCSMHGVMEAHQDIRETCVKEKYGLGAWFEFAAKMNSDCSATNADTCYEGVATDLGYDVNYIKSCEAENTEVYAAEDARLMKLFGAQGSPAIYLDGISYSGARDANSILAAVCADFDNAPAACGDVIATEVDTAVPAGSCG